jgi:acetyltransferase-like isoleucine patch superfamily enzyme
MREVKLRARRVARPIARAVRRGSDSVRFFALRASGVIGGRPRLLGRVRVFSAARGSIALGERVVLAASIGSNSLEARGPVILRTLNPSASILVGDDTGVTSSTISAAGEIMIGNRVLIGSGVIITDSDHHIVRPPPGESRRYLGLPEFRPEDCVVIEDDVFIGARSIVLKGVRIGRGAVIGAGSVVSNDIPPHSIAAGNPCRVVGRTS